MNYYESQISKIEQCLNEGKYKEAKTILDEELSMPYIPQDIEDKLVDLQAELNSLMPKENKNHLLSPDEILPALKKDNDSAMAALSTLAQVNLRNYLDVLKNALNDCEINHVMKNILIEQMIAQQIDEEIIYIDGVERKIRPNRMVPVLQQPYIAKACHRLEEIIQANPSFLDQCCFVLSNVAYDRYPLNTDESEVENIVFSIIRYVCKAYENEALWNDYRIRYEIDENSLQTFTF